MRKIFTVFAALLLLPPFTFHLSPLSAQTYVWKNGYPLVTDPDSQLDKALEFIRSK